MMPCMVAEDCDFGFCTDGAECLMSLNNCAVGDCILAEVCLLSGHQCLPSAPTLLDINKDGLPDGTLATLVEEEAVAAALTPAEWSAGVMRCEKSAVPCEENGDADCTRGYCSDTGAVCNYQLQNCYGQDEECILDEVCLPGALYVYAEEIRPSDYDFDASSESPSRYSVSAECSTGTPWMSAKMWLWGDLNNDQRLNVADVQLLILALQGWQDYSTLVNNDLAGYSVCLPQQILNIADLQMTLQAGEGYNYHGVAQCPEPCR